MRVYEFAKDNGLSSKDVLDFLKSAGFQVSNHMSILSDKEVSALEKKFGSSQSGTIEASSTSAKSSGGSEPIVVSGPVPLGDFSELIRVPAHELIAFLLQRGIVCNKNQLLPEEAMKDAAQHFEVSLVFERQAGAEEEVLLPEEEDADTVSRAPVVVVVGHVDHGKTSLLDYIRKARVAAGEKGGITQHLGAYEVKTSHGNVVFLDTPGHEAFDRMRARGVRVADVVILIVAADDGVMPQTIEAIGHARSMDVPIIVAINKVDKVDESRIEATLSDLSRQGLVAESWGGDTVTVNVSAKEGTGVDELLDILALQSEVLELKSRKSGPGLGYVLESKMEKGRGAVATVLLQRGEASVGDYFVAGETGGRINSLVDSHKQRIKKVGVSMPVQLGGLDSLAQAGDVFKVVPFAEYKKAKSEKKAPQDMGQQAHQGVDGESSIKILLKVDTNSTKEALVASIQKLAKSIDEKVAIVYSGVGNVTESDISLADNVGASIYAFGVKVDVGAQSIARRLKIDVQTFYVIYHLLDALQEAIEKAKKPEIIEEKSGVAEVRKVFNMKNVGVIAGCYVKDGTIKHGGRVEVYRNHDKVGEGVIKTLQSDRKTKKEVASGYECAFIVDGFNDWEEGDLVECLVTKQAE